MTTFFQPGGPQAGGPYYGNTAEPQQYYSVRGNPAAPAPQVDYHHPYPAYRPEQGAWSQPQQLPLPPSYQSPVWDAPVPVATQRNKLVALLISVALLLVAGAVTLIVVLTKADSAAPAGPQAPNPTAPVVSAPTSVGPVAPQPFPTPSAPAADVPSVPAQPVPAQPAPDQPAGVPGQQEAETAAGAFVAALLSSDFTTAAGYICSAQAAAFAAGASQLSTKVQLETLEFSGVGVTGTSAVMTMTYQAVGQTRTMHESLPMTVETGAWKICN
jgi:hypothetical protein